MSEVKVITFRLNFIPRSCKRSYTKFLCSVKSITCNLIGKLMVSNCRLNLNRCDRYSFYQKWEKLCAIWLICENPLCFRNTNNLKCFLLTCPRLSIKFYYSQHSLLHTTRFIPKKIMVIVSTIFFIPISIFSGKFTLSEKNQDFSQYNRENSRVFVF